MQNCCCRPLYPLCSLIRVSLDVGRTLAHCLPVFSSSAATGTQSQTNLSLWVQGTHCSLSPNTVMRITSTTCSLLTFKAVFLCLHSIRMAHLMETQIQWLLELKVFINQSSNKQLWIFQAFSVSDKVAGVGFVWQNVSPHCWHAHSLCLRLFA